MLIKFFARGTGGGRGPVEYITRKDDPTTGKLRYPAPSIIRGNPVITRRLIDSLEFKHKYRSGVLSFAPEDAPTDKQIEAVIDSFEKYAFAGLDPDAYNTLWVKHTHTENKRVELHFVTPRVELYTGKSLNIAPPGWHGYFKPWQSLWNIKQGWARPDDPTRKRTVEPGFQALINADRFAKGLEALTDTRQLLTEYVLERVTAGLITGRNDMIELFKEELGLEITRAGKDYVTVLDPETDSRYRLKGKLYEREFRPQPEVTAKIRSGATNNSKVNSFELQTVRARIRSNYQYRHQYHQKRYGASKLGSDLDAGQVLAHPSHSGIEPLSGYLRRQLGDDAVLIESDKPETGDVRLSGRANQFSGNRVETATRNSEVNSVRDSRDNDYANGQRDFSDSSPLLNSEQWLAMPGKTLYEIEIDNERTRKQTDDRTLRVSTAVQAGHDRSVEQIQYGHESVRGAEQAASYSSNGFEQTSAGLERANREVEFIQQQTDLYLPRIRGVLKRKRVKQLDRFKTEINLVDYAQSQGYEYHPRESSLNSAVLRHNSGDKIVVVTNTDGQGIYFSLKDDNDNGTIIDFVQRRLNLNLGEVRKELRPWLHRGYRSLVDNIAKPQPTSRDRISLIKECSRFSAPTSNSYLAKLGISGSTLGSDRFRGRIAIDSKGNVIFPHSDQDGITGYSKLNVNEKGFSQDGTKALWQSNLNQDDTRLVITARAIDALSYHQLFPDKHTRYISTEGMPSSYQRELIGSAIAELDNSGNEIIIGYSNDEESKRLADTLVSLVPDGIEVTRHVPSNALSWNEDLQRQQHFNQSSPQQSKQQQQQSQQSQLEP